MPYIQYGVRARGPKISDFSSKALERFWWKGEARRVHPDHVPKLTMLLTALDAAAKPEDMNRPSFDFHKLRSEERYAVKVDKNWRMTFAWSAPNAVKVDYEDYH